MGNGGFVSTKTTSKGKTYVYRYDIVSPTDGNKIERCKTIGLVREIGNRNDALEAAIRLGFTAPLPEIPKFGVVAQSYITNELKKEDGMIGRRAAETSSSAEHYLTQYIIPRWGDDPLPTIKATDAEKWFEALASQPVSKKDAPLSWPTISKIRGICGSVMKYGLRVELIPASFAASNPFRSEKDGGARCKCVSDYEAFACEPEQVLMILKQLDKPETLCEWTLVLLHAATGMRGEEGFAIKWQDIDWQHNLIHIRRAWSKGKVTAGKTKGSMTQVPMHPVLAEALQAWRKVSTFPAENDWVFASVQAGGRIPRSASTCGKQFLKQAAIDAGITTPLGKPVGEVRFGWHNLRHSLATYLANSHDAVLAQKALRHSNAATTGKYIHAVPSKQVAAQGQLLKTLRPASTSVQ